MTLTKAARGELATTRSLLNQLIEQPDLARTIQALPARAFAALIAEVGLEDAGEIVALATTEQLVQTFDEDLFSSDRAGERETFDVARFVVWLELLLEAGDEVAAERVGELDPDFVVHALSGLVLVLDEDALRERLAEGDEDEARQVDKALESALSEDLDGYILVAKQHDGWSAALALILALDRNHRELLVRLLDRLARVSSSYLDDLEELSTVLNEGESLAEDVEAAREERRSRRGYVEAQAARAFLALARKPGQKTGEKTGEQNSGPAERDPLTRAYFRELERSRPVALPGASPVSEEAPRALPKALQRELDEAHGAIAGLPVTVAGESATHMSRFMTALRELSEREPRLFNERMEEFAYLTNVLLAAHERGGARLRPKAAADAVLATVCYGATLGQRPRGPKRGRAEPPTVADLSAALRQRSADLLFRAASSALAGGSAPSVQGANESGLLYSAEELEAALATPSASPSRSKHR